MTADRPARPFAPPDGAALSSRLELAPYLSRPQYANFLPDPSGLLLVDALDSALCRVDVSQTCHLPLSLQLESDPDLLRCQPLTEVTATKLARLWLLIPKIWRLPAVHRPGAGLIILVDRSLFRLVTFERVGPAAALALRDWLRELRLDAPAR